MSYNHIEIESKWQKAWEQNKIFEASQDFTKPKFYALDMFPYPSAIGLHVGHLASYTPTEVIARYKRAKGFNVLHPIGYDAFGLPAEQYAIQTGIHPAQTTQQAIDNFRRQLKSFGFSFDWSREVSTCDPSYYKWTQFIFIKLFEKGLAYQKEVPVNWCPALKTVLANEEVIDGKSERGGHPVVRMPMKQWMLKITDFADRLVDDLKDIDWLERTKEGQKNWIGRSLGAEVQFKIENSDRHLTVFTTRPDTIFGVTFMVVAPEHPLVSELTTAQQKAAVAEYLKKSQSKSEVERKANQQKTGVFTGSHALNPLNDQKIPIWIADYVLMDYGTGSIMAVPGHDERDFQFAAEVIVPQTKTPLQNWVRRVLQKKGEHAVDLEGLPFEGDGVLVNSGFLDGLEKTPAIEKASQHLQAKGLGKPTIQYKFRDWLFSRQRYWGEPIPIVHYENSISKAVDATELPVALPEVADYEPSEKGEAPLAKAKDWVQYQKNSQKGFRETDTMPGSAGSSWYFLRYTDPKNNQAPFSFEAQKYWMPVDLYVGGAEHTVGHLLYARFWQKFLFDLGLVSHHEPFKKLVHQGMILGTDGEKMSKSRGNGVNPDEVREKFGSDAVRSYICFLGPLEKDKPWSTNGIDGVRRFLDRVWRLVCDDSGQIIATDEPLPENLYKILHKTIKKVSEDIESLNLNTAVSQMMILVNEVYKANIKPKCLLKTLSQLLMPFAPHFAEEIWQKLGGQGFVSLAPWPSYDAQATVDSMVTLAVQVSGKMRGTIDIAADASEEKAVEEALKLATVTNALAGQNPKKVIYKAGKILNLIS
jgi:leucyl-tRNA synthetase